MTHEPEDEEAEVENECYLLSEVSLAVDWNRPEENAAWAHLQVDRVQNVPGTKNERLSDALN